MAASNTPVNSLRRLGITGNSLFLNTCRVYGLMYGVHLSESDGAQINFRRTGTGVPAIGFTNKGESIVTGVQDPEDGFRADESAHIIHVVLGGTDAYTFTEDGIAIPILFTDTIESDEDVSSNPTDLTIKTGAAKTLVLETPVTNDLQFSISQGKIPASSAPTWDTAFTTNTGCYKFDVGEYIDVGANETPHSWVEGGILDVHLHVAPDGANATGSDRFAKFTVYVASADVNAVFAETSFTAELTISDGTADRTHMYLDMGNLNLSGYHIGAQIDVRVKRIAATGGTEFANDMFITQCGMHCDNDTMGSRTETAK